MRSDRIAGLVLLAIGGPILSFAGGRYAMGAVAQDQARRTWDEAKAHSALNDVQALALRDGLGAIVDGAPVARLVIPKIGLDEIVLEGVGDNSMNGGPGHFPGSSLPGDSGNAIISAHRDRHFRHFDQLGIGGSVHTESGSPNATWVIVSRRAGAEGAPGGLPAKRSATTRCTCEPIRYLAPAPRR